MALEAATFLDDFVTTNPVAGDNVSQGDDHIRLMKAVLKASLPNLTRATYLEQDRVDLASATTPDLSTPASNYINITGTTQIDGFATEPSGFLRLLRFNASLTLNYNATSLILPTSDDIITLAGDHAWAMSRGSGNWTIIAYVRANGKPLADVFPVPQPISGDTGFVLQATGAGTYAWTRKRDAGVVQTWPSATVPSWALECNGAAVSRTTYADLFAVISDDYGVGNGSTTFNLPDLRGEFIRGWDHGAARDPNAATRTNRGDGVTGDNVGTKQADEFESHTHIYMNDPLGNHPTGTGSSNSRGQNEDPQVTQPTGGLETRPRNVNMMYIITI